MRKEVLPMENDPQIPKKQRVFPLETHLFRVEKQPRAWKKCGVFHWKWLFSNGNLKIFEGKKQGGYINILSLTQKVGVFWSKYGSKNTAKLSRKSKSNRDVYIVDIHFTHFSKISKKGIPPLKSLFLDWRKENAVFKIFKFSAFLNIVKKLRYIFSRYLLVFISIYTFLHYEKMKNTPLTFFEKGKMWVMWTSTFCGRFI